MEPNPAPYHHVFDPLCTPWVHPERVKSLLHTCSDFAGWPPSLAPFLVAHRSKSLDSPPHVPECYIAKSEVRGPCTKGISFRFLLSSSFLQTSGNNFPRGSMTYGGKGTRLSKAQRIRPSGKPLSEECLSPRNLCHLKGTMTIWSSQGPC